MGDDGDVPGYDVEERGRASKDNIDEDCVS
jgi:hypothetical protein